MRERERESVVDEAVSIAESLSHGVRKRGLRCRELKERECEERGGGFSRFAARLEGRTVWLIWVDRR